uniref:Putative secreted protein n=1 Tax=Ixodes ricinus TaxID=34613 RepID=A0A6B0UR47_IXORI
MWRRLFLLWRCWSFRRTRTVPGGACRFRWGGTWTPAAPAPYRPARRPRTQIPARTRKVCRRGRRCRRTPRASASSASRTSVRRRLGVARSRSPNRRCPASWRYGSAPSRTSPFRGPRSSAAPTSTPRLPC